MQTSKYEIGANLQGLEFRRQANEILAALASSNAGDLEPAAAQAGTVWLDTSNNKKHLLKIRNKANSAWGILCSIDAQSGVVDTIDAYTKEQSDNKFLEKTIADESFALKTELPPLATETKTGIAKLKNSVTEKVGDAAVTEKALVEFVQSRTLPSLGIDQSWRDMTSSRDTNITYTNTTDKPIMVMISGEPNMEGDLFIFVNGVKIFTQELDSMAETSISFIVPPKATYRAEAYYGNGGSSRRSLSDIFNSRYKLWAELK